MSAMVFGLILAQAKPSPGKPDRTWRIELPKEPAYSVRLPADWRPRKPGRPGVSRTTDFEAADGRRMRIAFVANAPAKYREMAFDAPPAKKGKRMTVVSRRFTRGRWTGVAWGVRATNVSFMRPDINVVMTDGKALRMISISAPKGGVQPSEALAMRIGETLGPAKR